MPKPGYTTTEFWVSMFTTVISLITIVFHKQIDPNFNVEPLAYTAALLSSGIYTLCRTRVKIKAAAPVTPPVAPPT